MFAQYLTADQVAEVRQTILGVLGYDAATRNALLTGLPISYRALLPGGGAPPAIGLQLDLAQLNTTRRLVDAVVPLQVFLRNALGFVAGVEDVGPLRAALADVEGTSSGAAPVVVGPVDEEKIVARDDMVPFGFMVGGVAAGRAVARLLVPRFENGVARLVSGQPMTYRGTGWLVAPDLLMTNHHVVNARETGEGAAGPADVRLQALGMTVQFDYDSEHAAGVVVPVAELVTSDPGLDFALLRLSGDGRAPLSLAPAAVAEVTPARAMAVNVIQHPDGNPKRFGIRNNLVASATPTELRYFTDTLGGSSGSPVLDDTWQVVGLHRGSTFVRGVEFQGKAVAYLNVGTQITAIVAALRATHAGRLPELGI